MTLLLGAILPTSSPDPALPLLGDVRAAARLAEQAGLESVWSTDHLVASAPILDSTVALATAAAVTDRLRIGYSVLLLALRPAAWAAKQIGTLQYVSQNRLMLGVGTGNPAHGDIGWRAAGASFAERGARTDEALRVLPDLVAGKPVTLADGGEVTLAPGAAMPPVLVAGDGPRARRRAAEFAEGWITIGASPADVAASARELTTLAETFGRNAPAITVVAPPLAATPREAADQLAEYATSGAERVILAPSPADWEASYEFAAELQRAL
ncbi:LLM class flavin-dependent oxidoreductase [Nocardia sp. bgisy134]|uniref:LLM class flavin-dependent oxidoreductase n=1 Tax=Nocardia sp. bgisy134 TaxID=3413789 RepID=UPI003D7081A9